MRVYVVECSQELGEEFRAILDALAEKNGLSDKLTTDVKEFAVQKSLRFLATVFFQSHSPQIPKMCLSATVSPELVKQYPLKEVPSICRYGSDLLRLCIIAGVDEVETLIRGWDVDIGYELVLKRAIDMETVAKGIHSAGVEIGEHQTRLFISRKKKETSGS